MFYEINWLDILSNDYNLVKQDTPSLGEWLEIVKEI